MFEKVVKHVESYAIKLQIGFPSLIYGILIKQKHYIMIYKDENGVPHSSLNFS